MIAICRKYTSKFFIWHALITSMYSYDFRIFRWIPCPIIRISVKGKIPFCSSICLFPYWTHSTILLRATGYGDTGMGPIWEQTYRGTKRNFSFNTNPDNRAGYPAEYPEIVGVHRSYKRMPNEELRCVFSTDGNHYRPQVPLDNYESCLVPVPGLVPTLNGHGPNGRNGHNGTGKKHYVPELPILA